MRVLTGLGLALLCSTALFAQGHAFGSPQPYIQGSFGNVVFPGGTGWGIQRSFGNVVHPGGGGPRLVVPYSVTDPTFLSRPGASGHYPRYGRYWGGYSGGALLPYAVPVYAGGFYDNPYLGDAGVPPQGPPPSQAQPQQPNITVIYPPVQQPMVMSPYSEDDTAAAPTAEAPQAAPAESATPASTEPEHYLIAFKDRTIYAAVAYWVDGDTLHYFTAGNTHNQVSLSLVDKDLTERLNRESGVDVHLPK